ncbi:MAG: NAD(P)H-dependent oxidoreductase subunit E [Dehalococcoidia bacterium]
MTTTSGPSNTSAASSLKDLARQAIEDQPAKRVTVLSSLLAAQDALGYLPEEAIDEVALKNGASANEVWGVASFYPNFRFTSPARHTIEVCWGPTCHIVGAQPLLQGVMEQLGLDREGDTTDGALTLKLNTCLGVCPHGPAMSFDHQLAGHVTLEEAGRRIGLMRIEDRSIQRERALESEAQRERAAIESRVVARVIEREAAARPMEVDASAPADAVAEPPPAKQAAKERAKKGSTAKKKPVAKKKPAAKSRKRTSKAKKS